MLVFVLLSVLVFGTSFAHSFQSFVGMAERSFALTTVFRFVCVTEHNIYPPTFSACNAFATAATRSRFSGDPFGPRGGNVSPAITLWNGAKPFR